MSHKSISCIPPRHRLPFHSQKHLSCDGRPADPYLVLVLLECSVWATTIMREEAMPKLHELLAVEPDLEGTSKKVVAEARKTFDKPPIFFGFTRKWVMFAADEQDQAPPDEHQHMTTTVADKLGYVSDHLARYYDAVLSKETANQHATADLVVDGVTLLQGAPATFLLGLENKLKSLRGMYEAIPTLPVGVEWEPAPDL